MAESPERKRERERRLNRQFFASFDTMEPWAQQGWLVGTSSIVIVVAASGGEP